MVRAGLPAPAMCTAIAGPAYPTLASPRADVQAERNLARP